MDSKAQLNIKQTVNINQRTYQGDTGVKGEAMVNRLLQTGKF